MFCNINYQQCYTNGFGLLTFGLKMSSDAFFFPLEADRSVYKYTEAENEKQNSMFIYLGFTVA